MPATTLSTSKVQKRVGHGVNILTTYTWSRNMDASNAASNTFNSQPTTSQDNYNRARGMVPRDHQHARPLDHGGQLRTAFRQGPEVPGQQPDARSRGRRLGGQLPDHHADRLPAGDLPEQSEFGDRHQRPAAQRHRRLPETTGSVESRLSNYINPAAFSLAPQFTYGNVSRTITERGPGIANTDFSMFKTYSQNSLGANFKAQFRAEVFNLTNTPQFYGPNTTFGSSTFGKITTQANFPRVFQLGIRFML